MIPRTSTLAEFFAGVNADLLQEPDDGATLARVVDRAVLTVPGADVGGISLRRRTPDLETAAGTSAAARHATDLQHELRTGPAYDRVRDGRAHYIPATDKEERWEAWTQRLPSLGLLSVLTVRLGNGSSVLGALHLYAHERDAFTDCDIDVAVDYATHVGIALASARMVTGLRSALETRHLIGVCQGMLMQRYDISMDQSFELLRRHSTTRNVKLRELAEQVVAHRGLPDERKRR